MEFGGDRFPARVHIKINAMKIKLNRDLWNHKKGETFDVPDPNAIWAVKKGYDEVVSESQPENKAIEPKYKKNRNAN